MNNKLPEWRKTLNKSVENYQSMRAWYEENPDNPSAEQDMDAAKGDIEKLLKQYGVLIVLSLMDEIDELQELRRSCLALRGEIEDVQAQLYEAENRNNADDEELQERRKADEMMVAVCEVCSRPCNNPNHPQKAVRASDGVFTKDPCALANARGRKVQGYVELELANMFYKGNKD